MKRMTMIGAIIFASMILTSCGGSKKESEDKTTTTEVKTDATTSDSGATTATEPKEEATSSSTSDCDKFLKEYEEYVDAYVKVMKKYKANPTDASVMTEYTEMIGKADKMEKLEKSNAAKCNDPKYATKILQITNKMVTAVQ